MKRHFFSISVLIVLFLTGCATNFQSVKKVNIQTEPIIKEQGFQSDSNTLRFAVSVGLSPAATKEVFSDIVAVLAENTSLPMQIVTRKSITEVVKLISAKDVDVAVIPISALAVMKYEQVPITVGAIIKSRDSIYHYPVMLVHDPQITHFTQLKNSKVVLLDPASEAGARIAHRNIQKLGATPDSFFKNYYYSYSYDYSISAFKEGMVDAAMLDSWVLGVLGIYMKSGLSAGTIIRLDESIPNHVLVFSGRVSRDNREKILKTLRLPETQTILRNINIEDFLPVDDALREELYNYSDKRVPD